MDKDLRPVCADPVEMFTKLKQVEMRMNQLRNKQIEAIQAGRTDEANRFGSILTQQFIAYKKGREFLMKTVEAKRAAAAAQGQGPSQPAHDSATTSQPTPNAGPNSTSHFATPASADPVELFTKLKQVEMLMNELRNKEIEAIQAGRTDEANRLGSILTQHFTAYKKGREFLMKIVEAKRAAAAQEQGPSQPAHNSAPTAGTGEHSMPTMATTSQPTPNAGPNSTPQQFATPASADPVELFAKLKQVEMRMNELRNKQIEAIQAGRTDEANRLGSILTQYFAAYKKGREFLTKIVEAKRAAAAAQEQGPSRPAHDSAPTAGTAEHSSPTMTMSADPVELFTLLKQVEMRMNQLRNKQIEATQAGRTDEANWLGSILTLCFAAYKKGRECLMKIVEAKKAAAAAAAAQEQGPQPAHDSAPTAGTAEHFSPTMTTTSQPTPNAGPNSTPQLATLS